MDFGGAHKPPRFIFKTDLDPPRGNASTTTTSKRQRGAEDYQDQLQQQQQRPPQTRRMIGMGLAFPGSSGGGGALTNPSLSSPVVSSSSSRNDMVARVAGLVAPPPKSMIGCEASITSSSSYRTKGSGSATMPSSSSVPAESEEIENESHDARAEQVGGRDGGFSSVLPASDSNSKLKSPEVVVAGGGSRTEPNGGSSSGHSRAFTVEKNDVDENELGYRLSYLQMRGYDQALLDVMDEGILEESSEEFSSASEQGLADQVESEQQYTGVEISYDPRDQPAVVTPERL